MKLRREWSKVGFLDIDKSKVERRFGISFIYFLRNYIGDYLLLFSVIYYFSACAVLVLLRLIFTARR